MDFENYMRIRYFDNYNILNDSIDLDFYNSEIDELSDGSAVSDYTKDIFISKRCSADDTTEKLHSLMDLSAKVVAKSFPYAYVEQKCSHIPEPVAKKIMFWSFPENIKIHIAISGINMKKAFQNVAQTGFYIGGKYIFHSSPIDVSIIFDRCVITSTHCSYECEESFCHHVQALVYFRLHYPNEIPIHLPLSDSLSQLNREQLLNLTEYLLTKHFNLLLLDSQHLVNELQDKTSQKNLIQGAPDPTAGGDPDKLPESINFNEEKILDKIDHNYVRKDVEAMSGALWRL